MLRRSGRTRQKSADRRVGAAPATAPTGPANESNESADEPVTHKYPDFFHDNEVCAELLQMFSLFSNRTRFRILCVLSGGDQCVHELVRAVEGKYSNVSQQLKMLTLAGYVEKTRREREVFYHLRDERIRELIRYVRGLYGME